MSLENPEKIKAALFDIFVDIKASFPEKLQEVFAICLDSLSMENAVLFTTHGDEINIIANYKDGQSLSSDGLAKALGTIDKKDIVIIPDLSKYKEMHGFGAVSMIVSPLSTAENEDDGALILTSQKPMADDLSDESLALLKSITDWISTKVHNRQLVESLEESRQRYRYATAGALSAIWDWDIETDQLTWAGNSHEIFGEQSNDDLPQTTKDFETHIHPDSREKMKQAFSEHFKTREPFLFRGQIKMDNEYRWFESRAQAQWDKEGRAIRMLGTYVDITDYKKLEEELQRSNEELDQYAAIVSHDLRQPLRAIGGYMELLQMKNEGNLDEDSESFIQNAIDSSRFMSAMITDLLEFARVKANEVQLREVNVGTLLNNIYTAYSFMFEDAEAELVYKNLPTVIFDSSQIERVFMNLIDNAIKYSSDEAPVITVSAEEKDDEYIFAVADNGIGIPEDKFELIFDMLYRTGDKRNVQGVGIGLSLCKKIVENAGGKIWIESEVGKGSIIYFTIKKIDPSTVDLSDESTE